MAVFKNNSSGCVSMLDDLILTSNKKSFWKLLCLLHVLPPVWTCFLLVIFPCQMNQNRAP